MSRLHVVQNCGFQQTFNRFLVLVQAQFLLPCEILLIFKMTLCHTTCQCSANCKYALFDWLLQSDRWNVGFDWMHGLLHQQQKILQAFSLFLPFKPYRLSYHKCAWLYGSKWLVFFILSALCDPIRTEIRPIMGLWPTSWRKLDKKNTALLLLSWFCLFHLCAAVVFHLLQSLPYGI